LEVYQNTLEIWKLDEFGCDTVDGFQKTSSSRELREIVLIGQKDTWYDI